MLRHDYRRAAALYDSALMIVPNIISTARVRASYYKAKALAEVRGGYYDAARESLRQAFAISGQRPLRAARHPSGRPADSLRNVYGARREGGGAACQGEYA